MRSIEDSLAIIFDFLRKQVPDSARAIRAGASEAALKSLKRHLPAACDELEVLYRVADGLKDQADFVNGGTLLPIRSAIALYKSHIENVDPDDRRRRRKGDDPRIQTDAHWRRGWWPITDADGDHLVLDLDPAAAGHTGQVISFENNGQRPQIVVASSITGWLDSYAQHVVDGQVQLDKGVIWVPSFQG